ncbi:MAG TPA: rRNA pseudouridine synthase [Chloroflexi bacterium]|nr:rRNA pseudouridine synthase [Chloroflexota bacterium]
MQERVQKILAQAGFGSRRACEAFIEAGRVKVNGKVAVLGDKADPVKDAIQIDNREIPAIEQKVYIALYKPRKMLSDREPKNEHRPTIHDVVPDSDHLFSVGRLDFESEGLILLTNDGDLKQLLSHPRFGHEKEYKVLVAVRPDDEQLQKFRRGIVMEDGYRTRGAKVKVTKVHGKGAWLQVILSEGRKRQIRETCRLLGLPVVRIIRTRIGTLTLGNMKPKDWRFLTVEEVNALRSGKSFAEPSSNLRKPAGKDGRKPFSKPTNNPKRKR